MRTTNVFRQMNQMEERMLRAVMPRASEASPDRLAFRGGAQAPVRERAATVLTFTIGEGAVSLMNVRENAVTE